MILVVLAIAWAAALLPSWFRNRSDARAHDSILSFREQLTNLQRATPSGRIALAAARTPPSHRTVLARRAARRRRRDILFTLAAATVATMVLALVVQGLAVVAFVAAAAMLAAYTALLVRRRQRAEERAKVRILVTRQSLPEPVLLLRRSASQ